MDQKSLSVAFGDSLQEETASCLSDLAEIGLDAVMDDGILKDIPLLSTAVAVYKIGNSIKDRCNLKKLMIFLNSMNNSITDAHKRTEYRQKFINNEKFRNQELEYIMILIDRYISFDKPGMLAKLYLAYLDEEITWEAFSMYAEVIDRLLPTDYSTLQSSSSFAVMHYLGCEPLLRLTALGLLLETATSNVLEESRNGKTALVIASMTVATNQEKRFRRTPFGEQLVSIIG